MQRRRIFIPEGKLADDDAALKAQREALKKRLMEGQPTPLGSNGNAMGRNDRGNGPRINIPAGKLAYQWYEQDPELLEAEKTAMHEFWPGFTMGKLNDGRLYWQGTLCPGVYETKYGRKKEYVVMAVYSNNHPHQEMGSSVRVYPVLPDMYDLINECGFRPHHILRDDVDELYLCTNEAEDVHVTRNRTTSASSVLAWAVKWLTCYELVLTGNMTRAEFDGHEI